MSASLQKDFNLSIKINPYILNDISLSNHAGLFCFVSKTTSIAVESLHFNHIWIVWFEIQCGGVEAKLQKKERKKNLYRPKCLFMNFLQLIVRPFVNDI